MFASDDAIWPIYFAVVNRPVAQSYINWCEHPGNRTSRYLFSIGSDPKAPESWTAGTVYILPSDTFAASAGGTSIGPISRCAGQFATMSSARRITATITFMSCGSA